MKNSEPGGTAFGRFDKETQHQLLADDHEAWTHVCTILICIVTLGTLLGLLAVFICL